ncbi:DUF3052 domain-containing protein [Micrococcus sp.]|uniref:DUF3052 domain-containing protein n=1 Tax=Micrococcus sp. TaxID=1271 RepID=UPI002A91B304|nr:DUF3052 domain-containing protein [Micrococcus sp.]MDY6054316.1 DUF3052 domain-containing protein [Micrococcus sp.]
MEQARQPGPEHRELLEELGLEPGALVQEWGEDDDVDHTLRGDLAAALGEELLAEEDQEPADAVLAWWRHEDGDATDLADLLVDVQRSLDGGPVWLLTPRTGRAGHVRPADVEEAAVTAGLTVTTRAGVSEDWSAVRLVSRGG